MQYDSFNLQKIAAESIKLNKKIIFDKNAKQSELDSYISKNQTMIGDKRFSPLNL